MGYYKWITWSLYTKAEFLCLWVGVALADRLVEAALPAPELQREDVVLLHHPGLLTRNTRI